jgi:hypothetical protein
MEDCRRPAVAGKQGRQDDDPCAGDGTGYVNGEERVSLRLNSWSCFANAVQPGLRPRLDA